MSLKFGKQTVIVLLCYAMTGDDNDIKTVESFLLLVPKAFPDEPLYAVTLYCVGRYLARHDNTYAVRLPVIGAN